MERRQGDKVPAGSLAADRVLRLEVVSEPGNNAIDRILHLIEEAETQRAPIERFIDRFSRWYTPAMMLVALLVVLVRRSPSARAGMSGSIAGWRCC